jgi:hypothetical protein
VARYFVYLVFAKSRDGRAVLRRFRRYRPDLKRGEVSLRIDGELADRLFDPQLIAATVEVLDRG